MIPEAQRRELERDFVTRSPKRPLKLAEFTVLDLPDPARWRWSMVAVTDKNCVGLSNGVAWVRADGTAL